MAAVADATGAVSVHDMDLAVVPGGVGALPRGLEDKTSSGTIRRTSVGSLAIARPGRSSSYARHSPVPSRVDCRRRLATTDCSGALGQARMRFFVVASKHRQCCAVEFTEKRNAPATAATARRTRPSGLGYRYGLQVALGRENTIFPFSPGNAACAGATATSNSPSVAKNVALRRVHQQLPRGRPVEAEHTAAGERLQVGAAGAAQPSTTSAQKNVAARPTLLPIPVVDR